MGSTARYPGDPSWTVRQGSITSRAKTTRIAHSDPLLHVQHALRSNVSRAWLELVALHALTPGTALPNDSS